MNDAITRPNRLYGHLAVGDEDVFRNDPSRGPIRVYEYVLTVRTLPKSTEE
jgi:hypothetical protein